MKALYKKIILFGFCCVSWVTSVVAQEYTIDDFSNEQLASIYYAYPTPSGKQTPSPKGYEPFYISHYGRHGSRWITADERYKKVVDIFASHELTESGEKVKQLLDVIWADAKGRSGDLTQLGQAQHRAIADRMYKSYPQVFTTESAISARSTVVPRCIMSMSSFCEGLKENNPSLIISKEANKRYMDYLAYTSPEAEAFTSYKSPWYADFIKFEDKHINPKRFLSAMFKNPDEIRNPHDLMLEFYWITSSIQNVDLPFTLYGTLTKQELFNIWQSINYRMYVANAACPLNKGVMPKSASSLLQNILDSADEMISSGKNGATLRFGHDTYLIRLLALMQIEGCANQESDPKKYYQAWQDFRVSPMAGNLQMIFLKNKTGDILVKFLHNEEEVNLPLKNISGPYYKWTDVRDFYNKILQD